MSTLLLTRSDVVALLEPLSLLDAIKHGFVEASGAAHPPQRGRSPLPQSGASTTVLFPGLLPGIPAYTVKVHAKFPDETPALRGLIQLFDLYTGALLAVLDSGYLTALRTAAVGEVAADTLVRSERHPYWGRHTERLAAAALRARPVSAHGLECVSCNKGF